MAQRETAVLPIIIFDFDGTIADTAPLIRNFLDATMKKQGLTPVTDGELAELRNYPLRKIVEDLKLGRVELWRLVRALKKEIRDAIDDLELIEGMTDVLATLRLKGYSLGIVTSNDSAIVEQFFAQHNIPPFDFVLGGNGPFAKDRALKSARKKYATESQVCVYVGDETRDIDAARGADMPCIAVTWGFNSHQALHALAPDIVVNTPIEIVHYLDSL